MGHVPDQAGEPGACLVRRGERVGHEHLSLRCRVVSLRHACERAHLGDLGRRRRSGEERECARGIARVEQEPREDGKGRFVVRREQQRGARLGFGAGAIAALARNLGAERARFRAGRSVQQSESAPGLADAAKCVRGGEPEARGNFALRSPGLLHDFDCLPRWARRGDRERELHGVGRQVRAQTANARGRRCFGTRVDRGVGVGEDRPFDFAEAEGRGIALSSEQGESLCPLRVRSPCERVERPARGRRADQTHEPARSRQGVRARELDGLFRRGRFPKARGPAAQIHRGREPAPGHSFDENTRPRAPRCAHDFGAPAAEVSGAHRPRVPCRALVGRLGRAQRASRFAGNPRGTRPGARVGQEQRAQESVEGRRGHQSARPLRRVVALRDLLLQNLGEEQAEGKPIARPRVARVHTGERLGWKVARRASGDEALVRIAGKTEVHEASAERGALRGALGYEEHVGGFHVAVRHARRVQIGESRAHVAGHAESDGPAQCGRAR